MSDRFLKYGFWFVALTIAQILIFRGISFGWGDQHYFQVLIYPLLVIILPLNISRIQLMLIAFVMGFIIDLFYLSPGVHCAALVFSAFIRQLILNILEPRGGYKVNVSPTIYHLGMNWFLSFSAIMIFLHHLTYFSLEMFSFQFALTIWLKTIFSFISSYLFILALAIILNPK
jgi:hypothetical protein